eukprot:1286557-Lingulodinium_polyedra.AAC.1
MPSVWLRATLRCGDFSSVVRAAPSRTIAGGRPRLEYQMAVWVSGSPNAWRSPPTLPVWQFRCP